MAQSIPAGLEARVGFAAWRQPEPGSERYQLKELTLSGDEMPGWTLLQARHVRVPGTPPFVRSTWARKPDEADPLLLLDVHIPDSPASARSLALRLLGDFQSPLLTRDSAADIGEVAFGDGSSNWIVFVRGNLVVWLRNGGRRVVPVLDAARALDAALVRRSGGGQTPG